MNYETRKQFSGFNFRCAFCGYATKLDLTECPGCGRLKRVDKPKNGESVFKPHSRANEDISKSFANALPVAESYVYVCEFCSYQTFTALGECPECGRRKFAKFEVSVSRRAGADFRDKRASVDKSEIGKFLLIISISFFAAAFLTFFGFGPSGRNNRGAIVADAGENWHIAAIFFVLGIGSVIAGVVLKNKD